eukprot:m.59880 g.59880  ORF g.59880 m.59880 type:complete len:241 (+) comp11279_c0_seq2:1293-2015(+)
MLVRKLSALQFPDAASFSLDDEDAFRNLIVWLEDTKIRHYKIEERGPLRSTDPTEWAKSFDTYLENLKCPRKRQYNTPQARMQLLDWLLLYAISLEYSEEASKYESVDTTRNQNDASVDFQLSRAQLEELAHILKLPTDRGTDHELFSAIKDVVVRKLSVRQIAAAEAAKHEKVTQFPLDQQPLGFETGDPLLDKACKILRLLHIQELRELQTQVNELVVSLQQVTANPKTNSKLGQVGR